MGKDCDKSLLPVSKIGHILTR